MVWASPIAVGPTDIPASVGPRKFWRAPPRVIPEKSEAGGGVGYARGRGGVGPEVGATRSLTAAMYYIAMWTIAAARSVS